jgi:hypothetical protein
MSTQPQAALEKMIFRKTQEAQGRHKSPRANSLRGKAAASCRTPKLRGGLMA